MLYKKVFLILTLTSRHVALASPISSQPQNNQTIPKLPTNLPVPPAKLSVITFDRQSTEYFSPGSKTLSTTHCPADHPSCQIASTNLTKRGLEDIESSKLDLKRADVATISVCGLGYYLYSSKCVSEDVVEVTCYPQSPRLPIIILDVSCTTSAANQISPNGIVSHIYYCVNNNLPPPSARAKCVYFETVNRWVTPDSGSSTGYAAVGPLKMGPAPGKYLSRAATVLYDKNGYSVSADQLGFFRYDPRFESMGTCSHTESCVSSTPLDWTQTHAWAWVKAGASGGLTAISYIMEDVGF